MTFAFGDFFSYKASDAYRCMIIARNAANGNSQLNDPFPALHATSATFLAQTMVGHYIPRSWTGVGGSIGFGKHIDHGKTGGFGTSGSLTGTTNVVNSTGQSIGFNNNPGAFSYPNGPDGGLYLSPIWIHHSGSVRGYLKGIWAPCHDRPMNHNDTYSGTGNLAGKSFVAQSILSQNNGSVVQGQVHIETSNTWS